jgi:acyl-CoA oxidase
MSNVRSNRVILPENATRAPEGRKLQASAHELHRLLVGDLVSAHSVELRKLLANPMFRRQDGLTDAEECELAYRRACFVAKSLRITGDELSTDPRRLYALHEWLGLVDGVATTVLSIHYCLALGSLVVHGQDRPEVAAFIRELEEVTSIGVFLATELGYGNDVASLETEARYDPERREFVLVSPTPQSCKFMPNTGWAVPKLAVVMARLVVRGENQGVFPFVVRVRDDSGEPCAGVRIASLTEKPGYALDNAATLFDGVRIPKSHLLLGPTSVLHDDGRFESRIASRRERFLSAMQRVQTGRVCFTSAAVSVLRAATWIAVRYTTQRLTSAPGKRRVALLRYRNVQNDLFRALAAAYALTFAVRKLQHDFRNSSEDEAPARFVSVAVLKATASAAVSEALSRLRERCGAVGLLGENRILEYWNQVQGVITAEGDNQVMLLKVGRQLFDQGGAPVAAPQPPSPNTPLEAELAIRLLRFREAKLLEELRGSIAEFRRRTREPFAIWNEHVNGTIALASAHGVRLVAECFLQAIESCRNSESERGLKALFSLWTLGEIERHSAWFSSVGVSFAHWLVTLPRLRDALCESIEPDAELLTSAFDLDNAILQAPIAESDYIAAYQARLGLRSIAERDDGASESEKRSLT